MRKSVLINPINLNSDNEDSDGSDTSVHINKSSFGKIVNDKRNSKSKDAYARKSVTSMLRYKNKVHSRDVVGKSHSSMPATNIDKVPRIAIPVSNGLQTQ